MTSKRFLKWAGFISIFFVLCIFSTSSARADTPVIITTKGLPSGVSIPSTSPSLTLTDSSGNTDSNVYKASNGNYYELALPSYSNGETATFTQVTPKTDANGNPIITSTGQPFGSSSNGSGASTGANGQNGYTSGGVNTAAETNSQCQGTLAILFDVECWIYAVMYFILWALSLVITVVGSLFNFVFSYTVFDMSANINSLGAIDVAWKTMRDLANICFIFILLYLAISTILGLDEHGVKHTLSKLIIMALLLNFSMFFTKIIIDAANIISINFYNAINYGGNANMGDIFMSAFQLQTIYNNSGINVANTQSANTISNIAAFIQSDHPIAIFLGGSIFELVALAVLVSSIMMFIKRFVILVLVIIFSPLAFAGMVLHQTEHFVREWWNYLLKEAFFAAIYMIMLWVVISIIASCGFKASIGLLPSGASCKNSTDTSSSSSVGGQGLGYSFENPVATGANGLGGSGAVFFDFAIVTALLIAILIASEHMGVVGADKAVHGVEHFMGNVGGWVGSNTLGRIGNTVLNKGDSATFLRDAAAGRLGNNPVSKFIYRRIGEAGVGVTSSMSAGKYGGHHSYEDKVHHREEAFEASSDEHHEDSLVDAEMLMRGASDPLRTMGTDFKTADHLHHKWNAEKHANVMLALQSIEGDANRPAAERARATGALDRFYTGGHAGTGRLTPEKANQVSRAISGGVEFINDQYRNLINNFDPNNQATVDAFRNFFRAEGRTQAQILQAIKSQGQAAATRFMGATAQAQTLRDTLTEETRNVFNGERPYAAIASDDLISDEVKTAIATGGYQKTMLSNLYSIFTGAHANTARTNPAVVADFLHRLTDYAAHAPAANVQQITAALGQITPGMTPAQEQAVLQAAITAYGNEGTTHAATASYYNGQNGQRSQTRSPVIDREYRQNSNWMNDPNLRP